MTDVKLYLKGIFKHRTNSVVYNKLCEATVGLRDIQTECYNKYLGTLNSKNKSQEVLDF